MKRFPSVASAAAACAVFAAVALPGVGAALPARALTEGAADQTEDAQPAAGAADEAGRPERVTPTEISDGEPGEITVGDGTLDFGDAEGEPDAPVYVLEAEGLPEARPYADAVGDLTATFDIEAEKSGILEQPYSFVVTEISASRSLRIDEVPDPELPEAEPYATVAGDDYDWRSLINIPGPGEEGDDRWAFDVDHGFTTEWDLGTYVPEDDETDEDPTDDDEASENVDGGTAEIGNDSSEADGTSGADDRDDGQDAAEADADSDPMPPGTPYEAGAAENSTAEANGESGWNSVEALQDGAADDEAADEADAGAAADSGADDGSANADADGTGDDAGADSDGDSGDDGNEDDSAQPQVMCLAVESRSTDEESGDTQLPDGQTATAMITIALTDDAEEVTDEGVIPCPQDPENQERPELPENIPAYDDGRVTFPDGGFGQPLLPDEIVFPSVEDDATELPEEVEAYRGDDGYMEGPGLDLSSLAGSGDDWAGVSFLVAEGPERGQVSYRNSNLERNGGEGIFHDKGYNVREMRTNTTSDPYYRPIVTRDAHASWSFSEDGVYCVAVGVRQHAGTPGSQPAFTDRDPDYTKIQVGDAIDAENVKCPPEPEVDFPGTDDDDSDDADSGGSDDANGGQDSNGGRDSDGGSGSVGSSDSDGGRDDSGDSDSIGTGDSDGSGSDDGMRTDDGDDEGMDSESSSPSPTTSTPGTRVQRAPPAITPCPVDDSQTIQMRSGRFDVATTVEDGDISTSLVDARSDDRRVIGNGVTVVIPSTATRTLTQPVGSFEEGDTVWATEANQRGGRPQIGWDLSGVSEEDVADTVTISVASAEGPGEFGIISDGFGGVPNLFADESQSAELQPGHIGSNAFAFNEPGEYTITLDVAATSADGEALGPETIKLDFVVGDTNTAAAESPMLNSLLTSCPGLGMTTEIMTVDAPAEQPPGDGPETNQAQGEGENDEMWWIIAGSAMGLAVLLGLAVVFVLFRESRR